MASDSELTEKQEKFLEIIFSEEFSGNLNEAKVAAGYSQATLLKDVVKGVSKHILSYADSILAVKVPKCLRNIEAVMDSPDKKGAKTKLDATLAWMDRAGLCKKERLEIEMKQPDGIIVLPAKKDT